MWETKTAPTERRGIEEEKEKNRKKKEVEKRRMKREKVVESTRARLAGHGLGGAHHGPLAVLEAAGHVGREDRVGGRES